MERVREILISGKVPDPDGRADVRRHNGHSGFSFGERRIACLQACGLDQ